VTLEYIVKYVNPFCRACIDCALCFTTASNNWHYTDLPLIGIKRRPAAEGAVSFAMLWSRRISIRFSAKNSSVEGSFNEATVTAAGRGLISTLGTVARKQEISRDLKNFRILMLLFCLSSKFLDNLHDDTA